MKCPFPLSSGDDLYSLVETLHYTRNNISLNPKSSTYSSEFLITTTNQIKELHCIRIISHTSYHSNQIK